MTSVKPHRAHHGDGAPSNWQRYLDLLQQRGVPETAQPWYVRRVEEFLDGLKPKGLSALHADQVVGYLRRLSQRPDLSDWQRRQAVEALRLLLVDLAHTQAGNGVDWDLWRESSAVAQMTEDTHDDSGPRYARSTERFPILKDLSRTIRAMQYSIRTEQSYVDWCHRFLLFCVDTPLERLGAQDVQRFLTHLAVERSVAAKTQSLAFNAVVFLFRHVLERPLEDVKFSTAKRPARVPVVLSRDEMRRLFQQLADTHGLMARLMYGTGLRLMECVRLRVGDLETSIMV